MTIRILFLFALYWFVYGDFLWCMLARPGYGPVERVVNGSIAGACLVFWWFLLFRPRILISLFSRRETHATPVRIRSPLVLWLCRILVVLGVVHILAMIVGNTLFCLRFPPHADDLSRAVLRSDIGGTAEALRAGADIEKKYHGLTPLQSAVFVGAEDVVDLLLRKGASMEAVDSTGQTALDLAASLDRFAIAEQLVAHGADPNAKNASGFAPFDYAESETMRDVLRRCGGRSAIPLIVATETGLDEWVQQLMADGANVNSATPSGWTALHSAATTSSVSAAEIIVANGGDVNVTDRDGSSPLHYAAFYGDAGMVELFLKHGANPNLRNAAQETPLHRAACQGNLKVVNLLLGAGASTQMRNWEGKTPFDIAQMRGNTEAMERLRNR